MNLWLLLIAVLAILTLAYFATQHWLGTKKKPSSLSSPTIPTVAAKAVVDPPSLWNLGLKKSRESFLDRLKDALTTVGGGSPWNEQHPLWDRLEETLLGADLGPRLTDHLLKSLKGSLSSEPTEFDLKQALRIKMLEVLGQQTSSPVIHAKPHVTILIGVNGAGKTTTAGKLAFAAKANGQSVILGAADTFRAAAVDQLQTWADRLNVECIRPAQGANPAAVAFDVAAAAVARDIDVAIIDTAGRLHTKDNLMDELKKLGRVLDKKIPGAPHCVYLVLDASLGQNALPQAREFTQVMPVTGVILTKLDGTAKGGAVLAVTTELGIPISYVGLGEKAEDLRPFSAEEFVNHILN
jgi:fused signal recognition particle receptor